MGQLLVVLVLVLAGGAGLQVIRKARIEKVRAHRHHEALDALSEIVTDPSSDHPRSPSSSVGSTPSVRVLSQDTSHAEERSGTLPPASTQPLTTAKSSPFRRPARGPWRPSSISLPSWMSSQGTSPSAMPASGKPTSRIPVVPAPSSPSETGAGTEDRPLVFEDSPETKAPDISAPIELPVSTPPVDTSSPVRTSAPLRTVHSSAPRPSTESDIFVVNDYKARKSKRKQFATAGAVGAAAAAAAVSAALITGNSNPSPSAASSHTTNSTKAPVSTSTSTPPPTTAPPPPAVLASSSAGSANYQLLAPGASIKVVASGECWLEVKTGTSEGQVVFEGTLGPGQQASVTGPAWLRIGNPPAVSVSVNGQPLSPPGTEQASPINLQFELG